MEKLNNHTKQEAGEEMLKHLREGSLERQLAADLVDSLTTANQAAVHAFACQKLRELTGKMMEECQEDEGGKWLSHDYYLPIYKFYRLLYENYSKEGSVRLDIDSCLKTGRREIDVNPSQEFDMLVASIGTGEADSPPTEPIFIIEYQELRNLLLTTEEQPRKVCLIEEYRTTAAAIKDFIDNNRRNPAARRHIFEYYRQPLEQLAETCRNVSLGMEYAHYHLVS